MTAVFHLSNHPPSPIEIAKDVQGQLAAFLDANPVVETGEQAREAKLMVDRAKAALDEMEIARDGEVRPLNTKVKEINAGYKAVSEPLARILDALKDRLAAFIAAEEARRLAALEEARKRKEEAERLAREAEAREAEAKDDAAQGVIDANVGAAIAEADAAFADYRVADREAQRAERDAHVKIGGGFGRSLSLRKKETLIVEDAGKLLRAVGMTPKIEEALIAAARDYRRLKGKLPVGIRSETDRAL